MKTVIVFLILCLTSCVDPVSDFKALKAPMIIAGKGQSVVVVDCENRYVIIPDGYYLADALKSYNVGDTIKYFKKP